MTTRQEPAPRECVQQVREITMTEPPRVDQPAESAAARRLAGGGRRREEDGRIAEGAESQAGIAGRREEEDTTGRNRRRGALERDTPLRALPAEGAVARRMAGGGSGGTGRNRRRGEL